MAKSSVAEPVTIQQAFQDAKQEHSPVEGEHAPAPKASTEPAAPPPPAQHTEPAAGAPPTSASTTTTTDLIPDTDWPAFAKLTPEQQRAELNKRWTQKTQELSALKKPLEAKAALLSALDTDAEGTVRQLAQQLGLTIAPTATETATTTTAQQTATAIAAKGVETVKAALGPDLDFLAEPLSKAIHAIVTEVATAVAQDVVKPIQTQTQAMLDTAAAQDTETVLTSFETKHPGWKTHEAAMVTLGHSLQPGPGMSALDYMEHLYRLATFDTQVERAGADAVKRLAKGAADAETAAHPVADRQVTKGPPPHASIFDAYAAAKRGDRWE